MNCENTNEMKIEDVTNCKVALSRVDELNKLACFPCMGLHSSAGRELKREYNTESQSSNIVRYNGDFII